MAYENSWGIYAKSVFIEEHQWYDLTHRWEAKGVYRFPKGTDPKVNVVTRLEFELSYIEVTVQQFSHYLGTSLK